MHYKMHCNKVKKVNWIKIYTSIVKYQKDWDMRYNVEVGPWYSNEILGYFQEKIQIEIEEIFYFLWENRRI